MPEAPGNPGTGILSKEPGIQFIARAQLCSVAVLRVRIQYLESD